MRYIVRQLEEKSRAAQLIHWLSKLPLAAILGGALFAAAVIGYALWIFSKTGTGL